VGVLWDGVKMYETVSTQITDVVDRGGGVSLWEFDLRIIEDREDDQNALDSVAAASSF
jgi:hypothetical protein